MSFVAWRKSPQPEQPWPFEIMVPEERIELSWARGSGDFESTTLSFLTSSIHWKFLKLFNSSLALLFQLYPILADFGSFTSRRERTRAMNAVSIIGRLGGNPETRFSSQGTEITVFSLAYNGSSRWPAKTHVTTPSLPHSSSVKLPSWTSFFSVPPLQILLIKATSLSLQRHLCEKVVALRHIIWYRWWKPLKEAGYVAQVQNRGGSVCGSEV